jgi:hypothetical protein
VVVVGHRKDPAHRPERQVLPVGLLVVVGALAGELHRGCDQDCGEDVEHPAERVDRSGPHGDEHAAQDECDDDSQQQHPVLVGRRHRERRHDDDEHEQVVHR